MGYIQDVTPSGIEERTLEMFVADVETIRPEYAVAKYGD
jgi:hypothetical protein